jgi:hypothetical protein
MAIKLEIVWAPQLYPEVDSTLAQVELYKVVEFDSNSLSFPLANDVGLLVQWPSQPVLLK